MDSHTPAAPGLQVGVVGAGVAGLSAAIALRRIGHKVEIFERSLFKNENGAAVSIPPNGGRILKHWGFDSVKAGGIENIQVRRPKGDTLEPMASTLSFANIEQRFGNKWYFYHRVDMHRHLREIAEAGGTVIRLGAQVTDVDPESGMIHLKDGSQFQKDLVVVADGQHDRLNFKITGKEVPMQRSGQTAYRCLIPMKDILEDEETKHLFEGQPPGFWAPALPAKGVMAVTYPCRDNQILNVLAVHRKLGQHATSEEDAIIEDWNFPATHEDLEKVLDGFHPAVKKVFLKSPEVKVYTQMKRDPLSKMTKGKAVLIGDACHPMLLTHAQGVSSSIEDAAALEIFLADVPPSEGVSAKPSEKLLQRLEQFENFRLPRVSATQILTNPIVPGPQAAAKAAEQEAEIRKYYSGPLPITGAMPHSPPICQFFFGYDVRKEAIQYLEEANAQSQTVDRTDQEEQPIVPAVTAVAQVVNEKTLAETPAPTPVKVEEKVIEVSVTTKGDIPPIEQRVLDLERKLADMEKKMAQLVHISTTEVQLTPPQSPPSPYEATPIVFAS
ncbi:salicylate hydroxylase [Exophiala viscosa]|uniref:Salicylate hydroxylase n=1 Tax=Exophiala viscosa TaxID=2486360 RepID=A0AAN6DMS4_9EURO|nr:salicylate hydroxylase [Exophiala viscosa]KAI1621049.1 salicylate hydroxylase [Exophiala viscosa]